MEAAILAIVIIIAMVFLFNTSLAIFDFLIKDIDNKRINKIKKKYKKKN